MELASVLSLAILLFESICCLTLFSAFMKRKQLTSYAALDEVIRAAAFVFLFFILANIQRIFGLGVVKHFIVPIMFMCHICLFYAVFNSSG